MVLLDYEYSLWGLDEESVERSKVKHEVHLRSARKLQELCFRNGGIYIKLGQHIGQLVCSQFNRISNSVKKKKTRRNEFWIHDHESLLNQSH